MCLWLKWTGLGDDWHAVWLAWIALEFWALAIAWSTRRVCYCRYEHEYTVSQVFFVHHFLVLIFGQSRGGADFGLRAADR
jgi:hypothetical protein